MGDSERDYVNRLKEGDVASFEHLYTAWSGKLYNFVMRISGNDGYLAEELVQSVFIKVWENRRALDPDKSFGAYLCTIAKNRLANIYQHRMSEYLYLEKLKQQAPVSDNSTEKEVEYRLLEEYIDSLIAQLPPARREIVVLSKRQQLSNREIAEQLNLSEHTVESQLAKASAYMREKLTAHYKLSVSLLICCLNG